MDHLDLTESDWPRKGRAFSKERPRTGARVVSSFRRDPKAHRLPHNWDHVISIQAAKRERRGGKSCDLPFARRIGRVSHNHTGFQASAPRPHPQTSRPSCSDQHGISRSIVTAPIKGASPTASHRDSLCCGSIDDACCTDALRSLLVRVALLGFLLVSTSLMVKR
jgi:hypothetical protein